MCSSRVCVARQTTSRVRSPNLRHAALRPLPRRVLLAPRHAQEGSALRSLLGLRQRGRRRADAVREHLADAHGGWRRRRHRGAGACRFGFPRTSARLAFEGFAKRLRASPETSPDARARTRRVAREDRAIFRFPRASAKRLRPILRLSRPRERVLTAFSAFHVCSKHDRRRRSSATRGTAWRLPRTRGGRTRVTPRASPR